MSMSAVVNVLWLWLTFVTLTDGWPCSCDDNGCNVYNVGALMYRSLAKTSPNGNLLISPLSFWNTLNYAKTIASGDTKTLLSRVTFAKRPTHCKEYTGRVFSYNECNYHKLFVEEISPFWLDEHAFYSGSETKKYIDSLDKDSPNKITSWYLMRSFEGNDITQYIRDLLKDVFRYKGNFMQKGDITSKSVFVHLTEVRIEDKWRYPFKKTNLLNIQGKRYEMMVTSGLFFHAYDSNQGTRHIFLECQHTGISMVVVLPESNNLKAETSWDMLYPKDKQVSHLNVSIPKFAFEVEYSLKQVVYDIDCAILFSKECDISGVNGIKAPVSQIVQRTIVRVDEEGLMFEAYTILVSDPSGSPRDQPYVSSPASQPFMFYIFYDKYVVAQGRISDPFLP